MNSDKKSNKFGVKVEGELGDLQVIQESSDSKDDWISSKHNRAIEVSKIGDSFPLSSTTPVFGTVAVTNSENVQFGNNTYFNGPVTIKQVAGDKSGLVNGSYSKTEEEEYPKGQMHTNKSDNSSSQIYKIQRWIKLTFLTSCVVVIGVVCALLFLTKSDNSSIDRSVHVQPEVSFEESPLLIGKNQLRIVSRTDWLAQPPKEKIVSIKQPVPWVVITHTATQNCSVQSECVLRVRLMQTFHIESRNWSDIGYNFMLGGDGSVYYGRGWDYVGAHTLGYNIYSISIAFIGTFNTDPVPKQQVEACQKLINLGVKRGKLASDYKLFAHRQLMSTLSPGDRVFAIIKTWPHFVNTTDITSLIPNY